MMKGGTLSVPGSESSVKVMSKAPKMIFASEGDIRLLLHEIVENNRHKYSLVGSVGVFLSVLPMACIKQEFVDFLLIPARNWQGIYIAIALFSLANICYSGYRWWLCRDKTSPEYMLGKLFEGESTEVFPTSLQLSPERR